MPPANKNNSNDVCGNQPSINLSVKSWLNEIEESIVIENEICCYRDESFDGNCVWHADPDKKDGKDIKTALEDEIDGINNADLRRLNFNNIKSLELSDISLRHSKFQNINLDDITIQFRDINFKGTNFSNANMKNTKILDSDLSKCIATNASFENTMLMRSKFTYSKVEDTSFENANLWKANLSHSSFKESNFSDSNLWETNFYDSNLRRANLSNCNLRDSNLSEAELTDADLSCAYLPQADLSNTQLEGVNFSNSNLSKVPSQSWPHRGEPYYAPADLSKSNLTDSNMCEAQLRGVDFSNADLTNANLSGSNIENAVFVDANLEGANIENANAKNADFEGANMKNVRLKEADISESNFSGANMSGIDAVGADAMSADFSSISNEKSETNLENAILYGADLRGADFRGARLDQANLNDSTINIGTKFDTKSVYQMGTESSIDRKDDSSSPPGAWVHQQLEYLHERNALFAEARKHHIQKKEAQKQHYATEGDVKKELLSRIYDFVMQYGESPWRVIRTSALCIILFAAVYPIGGWIISKQSGKIYYPNLFADNTSYGTFVIELSRTLFDSLFFSATTFTTLGTSKLRPAGLGKMFVTIESSMGVILFAVLVFVLGRRATR